jgi:O-antigen/teichoic acid export membrane protein
VLSTGLALVIVIGGFSDLGTTRTVVRHVAADPEALRATFRRASALRAGMGAAVGLVAVGVLSVAEPSLPVAVVLASAAIAVASGVTEVGFASLRSLGRVGAEVTLLVVERLLFVVAGLAVVGAGMGPLAVLVAYAATNLVSAAAVAVRVRQVGRGGHAPSGPLLDAEGRRTAASSTLVIVGPRISILLLVLVATPTVVGTFTIAQKVPEALGALGTAALMPVLPMLRAAVVRGRRQDTLVRAGRITAGVAATLAPVVAWLAIDGRRALDLLFDAGHRRGIGLALAFLAAASLLWVLRTLGELVLLAGERAGAYLRAMAVGLAVNLVAGIWLVHRWGAEGAAGAAVLAEVVVLVLVVAALSGEARRTLARPLVPALGFAAAGAVVAVVGRQLPLPVAVAAVVALSLLALAVTGRVLVERRPGGLGSGAAGDDADVGAEVGGDLVGDGVETVEHGSWPAEHL